MYTTEHVGLHARRNTNKTNADSATGLSDEAHN